MFSNNAFTKGLRAQSCIKSVLFTFEKIDWEFEVLSAIFCKGVQKWILPQLLILSDAELIQYPIETIYPCRTSVIQPMQLGMDGKMREMTPEDLCKLTHNPLLQPDDPTNSGSKDEA